MIKNQLVIYRTFATQQYIFDVHQIKDLLQIPIPSSTKIEHITSNYPFTISKHQIHVYPIIETTPTSSQAIDETEEKNLDKLIHHLEIIIKYTNIKWKTIYNFFKNTNTLICYASITNETNFDFHTKDIKIVFRTIDHDYDIVQPKNLHLDIPTFHTKNILQIELNDIFDHSFVLSEQSNIEIWRFNVTSNEIYKHHIMDDYQYYCDSFLIIEAPTILLPGYLELYDRTVTNDIICLGTIHMKLYRKGDNITIHFPKNRSIKLKNNLSYKNHSFFIEKTLYNLETKIKKLIEGKIIVHFYIESHGLKNISTPPSKQDNDYLIWEVICEDKETIFQLNFSK
jgi:hypothetical protein